MRPGLGQVTHPYRLGCGSGSHPYRLGCGSGFTSLPSGVWVRFTSLPSGVWARFHIPTIWGLGQVSHPDQGEGGRGGRGGGGDGGSYLAMVTPALTYWAHTGHTYRSRGQLPAARQ